MKCVFCGGKTEKGEVTFVYEDEDKYLRECSCRNLC